MNLNEWMTLISSIGALLTAIVALCTLFELFKQRKSSYKPDLCILKSHFDIKGPGLGEANLALNWSEPSPSENTRILGTSLTLVNIGFGAAKNIEAKWNFNSNLLIQEINQLAQKYYMAFYIEEEDGYISIKSKTSKVYTVSSELDSYNFEYLLPHTNNQIGRELALPSSYTLLVGAFLSLCSKEENFSMQLIEIPKLELNLRYFDLGKGKHDSRHKLACRVHSISIHSGDTDKCPEIGVHIDEDL